MVNVGWTHMNRVYDNSAINFSFISSEASCQKRLVWTWLGIAIHWHDESVCLFMRSALYVHSVSCYFFILFLFLPLLSANICTKSVFDSFRKCLPTTVVWEARALIPSLVITCECKKPFTNRQICNYLFLIIHKDVETRRKQKLSKAFSL